MTNSIKDLAALELQKRLESMSTPELLRVMGVPMRRRSESQRVFRSASSKSGERPSVATLTVAEAVLRAIREARVPLSSGEIVEAAAVLRPGTAEPTIRAEISRMHGDGRLRAAASARAGERRFRAA